MNSLPLYGLHLIVSFIQFKYNNERYRLRKLTKYFLY